MWLWYFVVYFDKLGYLLFYFKIHFDVSLLNTGHTVQIILTTFKHCLDLGGILETLSSICNELLKGL